MSRLQKKCLIASGALHGMLVLTLVLTSAFLVKPEEQVDQQVLTIVPDKLVDAALNQPVGTPGPQTRQQPSAPPRSPAPQQHQDTPPKPATPVHQTRRNPPPEPAKPPPSRKPRSEPREKPEPQPQREDKPEPNDVPEAPKRVKPPKNTVIPVTPTLVPVSQDVRRDAERRRQDRERREKEAREREQAERQEKFDQARDGALKTLSSLGNSLSQPSVKASSVDFGTPGVSYGSYDGLVRKIYWEAWQPGRDISPQGNVVQATVVIRRDGTVESAVISSPSGNNALDRNIRQVLARVRTMGRPFPEGARQDSRTYIIEFNLEAKLGSG